MMNNYVSCEDCLYRNVCHEFDAFFGCEQGHVDSDRQQQVLGAYATDECTDVLLAHKIEK